MYSASGVKLQKKVDLYDLGGAYVSSTITNYSNGAEYDGNNNLVRLQHTEGSIVNNSGTFGYEYVLRDHLGNTRVTFGDADNNGLIVNSDIKQINSYYPFGLNMEGPGFGAGGANKYQYNGKELNSDFGLNWEDYGGRWYDPALARWVVVDPMMETQESWSPFHYAFGNPIRHNDPDGREPDDIVLRGANNSSVTIKTDLIDIDINASSLGYDFGGNYSLSGQDVLQAALDIGGIFDPTGALDFYSAKMSWNNGDYLGAGASGFAAVVPYVGDLAKIPKIAKGIEKIKAAINGVDKANKTEKLRETATIGQEAHRQIQKGLKKQGADIEVPMTLKDGTKVRKDAVKPYGTAVIIKPNTASGQKSAKARENLMHRNKHKTETILYDPKNPAYQKGSPTYIGPKK